MQNNNNILKVLDLLKITRSVFESKGVNNPRLSAELLLADTLKIPRINLYVDFEKPLNENELTAFREKVKRRMNHEPIQYILGYCEFYGLRFKVDPHVLIPRPETELLVDKASEILASSREGKPRILEIGTGSGCISIALAKKIECYIDAIDVNEGTLKIAKFNAGIHNVEGKISFFEKNFTSFTCFENYDLIISNPPYIPIKEYESLPEEIKYFEPKNALTDDFDGLNFYRNIIKISLNSDNKVKLLLEIGDGKRPLVENLLTTHEIRYYEFYKDLNGIDRVVYFEVN